MYKKKVGLVTQINFAEILGKKVRALAAEFPGFGAKQRQEVPSDTVFCRGQERHQQDCWRARRGDQGNATNDASWIWPRLLSEDSSDIHVQFDVALMIAALVRMR